MKTNKNGLPIEIKYCEECNISNQQPLPTNEFFHTKNIVHKTIKFDKTCYLFVKSLAPNMKNMRNRMGEPPREPWEPMTWRSDS